MVDKSDTRTVGKKDRLSANLDRFSQTGETLNYDKTASSQRLITGKHAVAPKPVQRFSPCTKKQYEPITKRFSNVSPPSPPYTACAPQALSPSSEAIKSQARAEEARLPTSKIGARLTPTTSDRPNPIGTRCPRQRIMSYGPWRRACRAAKHNGELAGAKARPNAITRDGRQRNGRLRGGAPAPTRGT